MVLFLHLYSTADIREMNNVMQTSMKHDAKLYFYANIQYERNTIVPWTLCQLKKNDSAVQPTRNNIDNNPIVISDSDDDDVPSCKCFFFFFFSFSIT